MLALRLSGHRTILLRTELTIKLVTGTRLPSPLKTTIVPKLITSYLRTMGIHHLVIAIAPAIAIMSRLERMVALASSMLD